MDSNSRICDSFDDWGFGIPEVDASCAQNSDWPQAPCFDYGNVPKSTFVERWTPYYDFKGEELMEQKKIELLNALETDSFEKWINSSENYLENSNVYNYYLSTGEIAKQYKYGGFIDYENKSPKKQQSIYTKPYDLKCKEGLFPIILQNENYACVKFKTRDKMLEKNLIHDSYYLISVVERNNYVNLNSFFQITVRNEGMVPIQFDSGFFDIPIFQLRENNSKSLDPKLLHPGEHANYRPWSNIQLDDLKSGKYQIEIIYHSDIHKKKKSLNYEINFHDEFEDDDIANMCLKHGGIIAFSQGNNKSFTICSLIDKNTCENIGGVYGIEHCRID